MENNKKIKNSVKHSTNFFNNQYRSTPIIWMLRNKQRFYASKDIASKDMTKIAKCCTITLWDNKLKPFLTNEKFIEPIDKKKKEVGILN